MEGTKPNVLRFFERDILKISYPMLLRSYGVAKDSPNPLYVIIGLNVTDRPDPR